MWLCCCDQTVYCDSQIVCGCVFVIKLSTVTPRLWLCFCDQTVYCYSDSVCGCVFAIKLSTVTPTVFMIVLLRSNWTPLLSLTITVVCGKARVAEDWPSLYPCRRLVGLVVKASASRVEGPGFESRLRRDFFGVKSYQ